MNERQREKERELFRCGSVNSPEKAAFPLDVLSFLISFIFFSSFVFPLPIFFFLSLAFIWFFIFFLRLPLLFSVDLSEKLSHEWLWATAAHRLTNIMPADPTPSSKNLRAFLYLNATAALCSHSTSNTASYLSSFHESRDKTFIDSLAIANSFGIFR